ncbi:MAG: DAK2 domain-containing protein [Candidatus Aquicultor sp.]|nr:DAK2 domain-containing protein [Candidatus Aquicultor sp.]
MKASLRDQLPETITKSDIAALVNASLAALIKYQDEINRLNVYPVPDGDTGTNMVLTMKIVRDETVKAGDVSLAELAKVITYGSLMGARGNSGVILSQIIRGICESLAKYEELNADAIIEALDNGATAAYGAVKKPVEGTMLTVIRDMANAGMRLLGKNLHPSDLLSYIIEEGKRSVERTPELLSILKESGVVDAGGYGLLIMAKGILSAQKGIKLENGIVDENDQLTIVDEGIEFAYCTEFILKSEGIDLDEVEIEMEKYGDSVLVVGTPELTKIHVHTNDPGAVVQIATGLGTISEVQINNIIEQSKVRTESLKEEGALVQEQGIGIIAVASGEGVKEILSNLGVHAIVDGGQSMNPSTADLVAAVNKLRRDEVIILPNNKNIIMAAQQVDGLTDKKVRVVATTSVPEAFGVMLAFDEAATLDQNIEAMTIECDMVKTGEVTYAVRDTKNGEVKKGETIGLYAGDIKASGGDVLATTMTLLETMIDDDSEVVTILAGDTIDADQIDELSAMFEERFPDVELDMHYGGQPVYYFLIGIE